MDSISRAQYIRDHMPGLRHIYWDRMCKCFRVMQRDSMSFVYHAEHNGLPRYELVL